MRSMAVGLVAMTLAACGGSDRPTEPVNYTNVGYHLVSVNGQPVPEPVDFVDGTRRVTAINSGDLFFRADNQISMGFGIMASENGAASLSSTLGMLVPFTIAGNTITLTFDAPIGVRTGAFSGAIGARTMTFDGGSGFGTLRFHETS